MSQKMELVPNLEVLPNQPRRKVHLLYNSLLRLCKSSTTTFNSFLRKQGETMWHILNSLGPDEETFLRITRVNVLKVHYIGFLAYIGFKVDSVAPLCNNMRLNWFYRHTACLPGIIWMVFVKLASGKTLHQVVCRLWQCPILLPVAGGQGSAGLE